MKRLAALGCLVALAAGCTGRSSASRGAPVFIVCVDTLRADRLPAYGYTRVETPALDALARDSIVYDNAISHVPLTLPSHVSLFTGLLPFQHGVRDNLGYRLSKDHRTLATLLKGSGYATGGAVSAIVLDHGSGVSEGFDFYEDAVEARDVAQAIGQVQRGGDETERLLEGWVSRQPSDARLFGFLHLYEPHSPYTPPEPFRTRYASSPYDGEVAASDRIVGQFVAFLKKRNLYDRSVVVFLSDHGEGLGDHGEDEHGIFLYREEVHVPLFVKLPGGRLRGKRVSEPAQIADVVPTVLAALGEKTPESLPGRSLLDFAEGRGAVRRIYSETVYPRYHFGWSDLASLTDDRHQYIHSPRPELYDWREDPAEKRDLSRGLSSEARSAKEELPPAFRSMRAELAGMDRPLQSPGASDPETVKKLASLGYIGAAAPTAASENLPDPKDRIGAIEKLKQASRLSAEFRDAEGIALLTRLAEENPLMLDVWETLARLLRRSGRTREALAALERADRLAPGTPQIMLGLADLHRENRDYARARALALAAGEAGAPGVREELAKIALAAGDLDTARREAETVLAKTPDARAPRLVLARVAIARGDLTGALAILDQVAALDRASARTSAVGFHSLRGDVLARLGREKEAEADFRSEVASYPENLDGWARLALLYASQARGSDLDALLSEMTRRVPTPQGYDAALRVCGIIGDSARSRDWSRRKAERFGSRG
jgi:arylsulfatase A-like enzyme/tetratricopeptide (TPR) repeat protein